MHLKRNARGKGSMQLNHLGSVFSILVVSSPKCCRHRAFSLDQENMLENAHVCFSSRFRRYVVAQKEPEEMCTCSIENWTIIPYHSVRNRCPTEWICISSIVRSPCFYKSLRRISKYQTQGFWNTKPKDSGFHTTNRLEGPLKTNTYLQVTPLLKLAIVARDLWLGFFEPVTFD